MRYVCSHCGAEAYYDGRCGDGAVLVCGCDRPQQVRDRIGFANIATTDAKPIPIDGSDYDGWLERR